MDDENAYDVLDRFVGWLDSQGIKPKTLTGYVHAAEFLLFLDVRIDAQRFREKVDQPRILKIEDVPAPQASDQGRPVSVVHHVVLHPEPAPVADPREVHQAEL